MKKVLVTLGLSASLVFAASITEGKKAFESKKYENAYSIFTKVAQDGMVAKYNMAYMNELGLGVKKDMKKAITLYTLSANDGYSVAQNALGNAYLKGLGVKKDLNKAVYYYKLAAAQKNKNAMSSLKLIQNALKKKKQDSKNLAYVTIRSNVNNDKVYIDGKYVGKTKLTLPINTNHTYQIEIRKDGYETYKFQPLRMQPKEKRTIRAVLKKR